MVRLCSTRKLGPEYALLISRMTKLEAAVSQIEIGQYGYCCDCEEKISAKSLEQDPCNSTVYKVRIMSALSKSLHQLLYKAK